MGQLPTPGDLDRALGGLRDARVHVVQLEDKKGRPLGNHGDWLMHLLFERYLASRGLIETSPRNADALIIPPNGALIDIYDAPVLLRNRLQTLPNLPLYIFPSSARFLNVDPASMFESRSAPTVWVCRERYSLDNLRMWNQTLAAANVQLQLSHDVVVATHEWVDAVFPYQAESHALLVGRLGAEAEVLSDSRPEARPLKKLAVKAYAQIPSATLRRGIRSRMTEKAQGRAADALRIAAGAVATAALDAYPRDVTGDISDPTLFSRKTYVDSIAGAGVVVTNRLHVALPSAILGKPTWLVESGYHKLRGVYEQSLTGLTNLTFVGR